MWWVLSSQKMFLFRLLYVRYWIFGLWMTVYCDGWGCECVCLCVWLIVSMYTCLFFLHQCCHFVSFNYTRTPCQLMPKFIHNGSRDVLAASTGSPQLAVLKQPRHVLALVPARNGDPGDMDRELRQRRAAQILISGAVFELDSLSQSLACGTRWWVEKATQ